MKMVFKMEKATKNTIRFEEVLASELDVPKIGSIYIPKATLGELKWSEGDEVEISITLAGK